MAAPVPEGHQGAAVNGAGPSPPLAGTMETRTGVGEGGQEGGVGPAGSPPEEPPQGGQGVAGGPGGQPPEVPPQGGQGGGGVPGRTPPPPPQGGNNPDGSPPVGGEGVSLVDASLGCWVWLRGLPKEAFACRPPLLQSKFTEDRRFGALLDDGLKLAAERAQMVDVHADVDAQRLVYLLPALLMAKHRPGEEAELRRTPWLSTVQSRLARLQSGEFKSLFTESRGGGIGGGARGQQRRPDRKKDCARTVARAVEMARRGNPSKSLSGLSSKGSLSMGDREVREMFTKLQVPHATDGLADVPVSDWAQFVRDDTEHDLPPVSSPFFRFNLAVSNIAGPDGVVREVDTLEHVWRSMDRTSSPGLSGLDFAMLRKVSPESVRPLLEPHFGNGRWDYTFQSHRDTHDLLVSNLGIGLDKKGLRHAADLRPIGIGEALRRIAGKCILLQEGEALGAELAKRGQFGVGFKNGTETIYHMTAKVLEALHASGVPCGSSESDATNAYCSIHRSAIQRGIAKHSPQLLPVFDFLYGPNAQAKAYFYAGPADPVGSCDLPSGVHQGDVLGPLFFAYGFDELVQLLRERMADLPVDSTMLGELVVPTAGAVVVRQETGTVYSPVPMDQFRLIEAPSYQEVEAEGAATAAMRVIVQLLPGGLEPVLDLGLFSVAWSDIKLSAHPLIICYLDDIKQPDKLFLMRPFSKALRDFGPTVGLTFTKRAKNYFYVPLPYRARAQAMYPDAIFVDDDSPGDSPGDQLKVAADTHTLTAPENLSRLLITSCGVERLMGSPLRLVEREGEPARVSTEWLRLQVKGMADSTALLFAHLGLQGVDNVAKEDLRVPNYPDTETLLPRLPEVEPQLQNLIARVTLGRRLNHVSRVLPPGIALEPLARVELLLSAVVAGLMRKELSELPVALRRRLTLPARWSGSLPGGAVACFAQNLSAAVSAEAKIRGLVEQWNVSGTPVPPALLVLLERETLRANPQSQDFTPTASEEGMLACMMEINRARANPGVVHESLVNTRGPAAAEAFAAREEEGREVANAARVLARGAGGAGALPPLVGALQWPPTPNPPLATPAAGVGTPLGLDRPGGGAVGVVAPPAGVRHEVGEGVGPRAEGREPLSFQNVAGADTNARRLSETLYKAVFGELVVRL